MRTATSSFVFFLFLLGPLMALPSPVHGQSSARAKTDSLIREAQKAMQSEDYRAAQRYYEAAVAADRTSPDASCGLGQVYMALRQFEQAVGALRNCKKQILTSLRRLQTERARSQGAIDDEIRELRDAIEAIQSGRVKSAGPGSENRLEQRIHELEQMKSGGGFEIGVPPEISFALGTALLQVGRLDEAEGELLEVIRSRADVGDAHNNLAAVYLAQGRWDEAEEQIRLAEEAGVGVDPQMKRDLEFRNAPSIATTGPDEPVRETTRKSEPVSLEHKGRTCALRGVFVRIEASVRPSWGIYDPIVRFRTDEAGGWYSTVMLPAGEDSFAAFLPRPRSSKSFEYYIEVSSYDEKETRTEGFRVPITNEPVACPEAAGDPEKAGGILIIDPPRDVANAPPVPDGFSIRGTTADAGVLEMGQNKALVWGAVGLGAAIAGGIAVANRGDGAYSGPMPFSEAPGIALVATDPPQGSTLSLSSGQISLQLNIFSLETMPGARIIADLSPYAGGPPCISVTTTQDLTARQTASVMVAGPTIPVGGSCDTSLPLESLSVKVLNSGGLGGFRTGLPPLLHIRILFQIVE